MAYDLFILGLTILGILSVVVYSVKISRSQVHPIGMVRKLATPLISTLAQADEDMVVEEVHQEVLLMGSVKESAPRGIWRCENCGLVQYQGKNPQCRRCKQVCNPRFPPPYEKSPEERGQLTQQVSEQSDILEIHSKMFKEFDKRIRRLELESVKKSQEAFEERPQQQADLVN